MLNKTFSFHPSSNLLRLPIFMLDWVKVANVSEVAPSTMRGYEINGQRLLLINVEGEFFAIDVRCPHRDGPLDRGHLYGRILECPWHYYRYDVKTGENLYPRNVYPADLTYLERDLKPLQHYRVRVEGDEILVEF